MPEFEFENCLLKHYIRKRVWLPFCERRLTNIRTETKSEKQKRRLKYFTFCAVGALDVLMLDREKIIRQSNSGDFDTVVFFDIDEVSVSQTNERIPGAIGIPGDFVKIVLLDDIDDPDELDSLGSLAEKEDEKTVWKDQIDLDKRRRLIGHFPFDVINLDIEQYLFRPKEQLPGRMVRVIRKILDWQKRQGETPSGEQYKVSSFDLMFTTRIGPYNLPDDYINYLKGRITHNLNSHEAVRESYNRRTDSMDIETLFGTDFDTAFKIAVPKSLADLVFESDWYVDNERGINVYQFCRDTAVESYTMLHMAMTIHRQDPPFDDRGPGVANPVEAVNSHIETVKNIFFEDVFDAEEIATGNVKKELKVDLQRLFNHRDKFLNVNKK